MTSTPSEEPAVTNEVQAGVPMVPGQQIQKQTLQLMWGGVWVPMGTAEFLVDENSRIIKVISFTPQEFRDGA
jgi:hypothetical protein